MIKRSVLFVSALFVLSCNNDKEEIDITASETKVAQTGQDKTVARSVKPEAGNASLSFTVDGNQKNMRASILVQKDKSKLSPGNEYSAILTANEAKNTFTINFIFSLKPGSYPIVGLALSRDMPETPSQIFGAILGGKPKMTDYKVDITQMENLGENKGGGNRWKISGTVSQEVVIHAAPLMKMEKTHPESISVSKISFSNLEFDDNWEEMLEKSMNKLKK
jgi:hypothetical protein